MRAVATAGQVAAGVIGGFVGGLAIATSWKFSPQKDFWDVVTAIGTVAAATIALLIALRDGKIRAAESWDRAQLAAAGMAMKGSLLSTALTDVAANLDHVRENGGNFTHFEAFVEKLDKVSTIKSEEVEALVPLPNRCAHKLAGALDRIESGRAFLLLNARDFHASRATAHDAAIILREAQKMLDVVVAECQKASFLTIHSHA